MIQLIKFMPISYPWQPHIFWSRGSEIAVNPSNRISNIFTNISILNLILKLSLFVCQTRFLRRGQWKFHSNIVIVWTLNPPSSHSIEKIDARVDCQTQCSGRTTASPSPPTTTTYKQLQPAANHPRHAGTEPFHHSTFNVFIPLAVYTRSALLLIYYLAINTSNNIQNVADGSTRRDTPNRPQ